VIRFGLRADDGSPLVVHVGPETELPMLRPGDQVVVAWEPDAGRLLRPSERVRPQGPEEQEIQELAALTGRSEG